MFCTKCGNQLPENSKFCKYCGNPVRRNQSLLERARNQEEDALAEIYNQSSSAVYRVIKVLVKDEDTVYDILQDTYVKAFTRLDQLQDESKLVPWLKMIANNTAKDWLKKCKPVVFTDMSGDNESDDLSFEESIEDERTDLNPEMAMDEKEVRRLVLEILDQLPEDQRLVIGMFYYEEMSVKDIAFTLGVSDNTVKSRLSYGRKKVKELVLDLEKKGTKLYTVAPFTFFVYMLHTFGKSTSVEAAEMETLQSAFQTCIHHVTGEPVYENIGNTGNVGSAGSAGNAGNPAGSMPRQSAAVAKSSASVMAKTAGTAAGTVAKHAGLKAAAIILAGVVGGGGAAYGVIKNADKIPIIKNLSGFQQNDAEQDTEPEEINDENEAEPTEAPEETTDITKTTESTETSDTEDTESADSSEEETENTSEPEQQKPEQQKTEQQEAEQIPKDVIYEGEYGENIHWYIGADGTLTVNGNGAMPDITDVGSNPAPWYVYNDQIRKINIGNGITRIGDFAFAGNEYVSEISMSDTVTEIGQGAFQGVMPRTSDPGVEVSVKFSNSLEKIEYGAFEASNISSVELPDSVREIADYAFHKCYSLRSITIGEKSHLEYVGREAFEDSTFDLGSIYIPQNIKTIKSVAFGTGNFADTVIFSDQLQELGLCAFGYGSTGLNTVYFMGDAPMISDDRIAISEDDTVFPDTTTKVYYPIGNSTWDGFDFSKLGKNMTAEPYDPSTLKNQIIVEENDTDNNTDEKSDKKEKTAKSPESKATKTSEKKIYKKFYRQYIKDENLQVVKDGYSNTYNDLYENGYTDSMLLSAYIDDFGGDGKKELLLVRTKDETVEKDYGTFVYSGVERKVYVELYGIDDGKVVLRHSLGISNSDLSSSAAYITEQIGSKKTDDGFYLYRYGMQHGSTGGGSYGNTILKVTDTAFLQEHDMYYTSSGAYQNEGQCEVDGTDYYTGNSENDTNFLNNILQQYGLAAHKEIAEPDILNFNKNEQSGENGLVWIDTFSTTNCFVSKK